MSGDESASRIVPTSRRTQVTNVLQQSLQPLGIFVLSRVAVYAIFAAVAMATRRSIIQFLVGWDSRWYLMIAHYGYVHVVPPGHGNSAQCDLGFFPLIPLAIRGVHGLTGLGFTVSGLVTSSLFSLLGAVAVWWMVRDVDDAHAANRATALIMLSPAAFVLSMVYSEGAIIFFVSCSILALRRQWWLTGGLFAALATVCDPVGVAAVAPCVIAALIAIRRAHQWRALVAPLVAPLGVLTFFGYLWAHTGSPFTWFHAQRVGWQRGHLGTGVVQSVLQTIAHGFANLNPPVKVASLVLVIGLLIVWFRNRPPHTWTAYVVGVLVLGSLSPIVGVSPRLLLRAFPLFAIAGARLPRQWFEVMLGLSIVSMAALAVVSTSNFWTP